MPSLSKLEQSFPCMIHLQMSDLENTWRVRRNCGTFFEIVAVWSLYKVRKVWIRWKEDQKLVILWKKTAYSGKTTLRLPSRKIFLLSLFCLEVFLSVSFEFILGCKNVLWIIILHLLGSWISTSGENLSDCNSSNLKKITVSHFLLYVKVI